VAYALVHGSVSLIEGFYAAIKNQIPHARDSFLQAFGEILFKAWHDATDPQLQSLEYCCIQDLMHCAAHAGHKVTVSALRKVVGVLHQYKKQPGVDEMLCRLYEPILWRGLRAANLSVRCNCAQLFFDGFPLVDQSQLNADIDMEIQSQFNIVSVEFLTNGHL